MSNLATLIKTARGRAGLSQSQAAKAWNVEVKSLQNWEQGTRSPRGETLMRLLPFLQGDKKAKRSR